MYIAFTLISCAFFIGIVAWYSYYKTKNTVSSSGGFFLGGRGLTGGFIAGALILTNLSAEQLIGLNGQGYQNNLSSMGWEVTAGFSVIILATILLPKYLGGAFTTLPEFINNRFDKQTRLLIVLLFMVGYGFITIPSVLYSGSLAVLQIFDIPHMFHITYEQSIWVIVWVIGIIGMLYAILGGLKAIAISDTLNGIGLLIVGVLVPILGFIALGNGSLLEGMKTIATDHPEKLNAIGSNKDDVPFGSIFTGMIFANLFYWGTNQYVIQRTLGAKSLAEGQKGALFTGFLKILVPFLMMIPGVIAFHLYGSGLKNMDLAYPTLVKDVFPTFLDGFFLAVLLGAVFSSFNALLNSASTLFVYDIYKVLINNKATDRQMIRVSQWFGVILALATFFISPMLMNAPQGLWTIIRQFTGFFNIPIIAIVLVGIFAKRVPAIAPKIVIISHVIVYYLLIWGLPMVFKYEMAINFIYIQGLLFVVEVLVMLIIGMTNPLDIPFKFSPNPKVDMTPWKYTIPVTVLLLGSIVFTFILFSPIGLAAQHHIVSSWFWPSIVLLAIIVVIFYYIGLRQWSKQYETTLKQQYNKELFTDLNQSELSGEPLIR
ncbi:solute:sodium symporter family transporter [Staphylococcus pseudoxylosus]|uniref:Solute:sodium symporter family transporter n=1 Tax=Staphylococcus pseudoxylosus TaxID=2282419 RepID=A0AAQ0S742_9STAP|nr:solute:sodium symporter family transporter [Staphylococcus pseudoxylosus]MCE5002484.1 solute:sodium symporter family transporter [Staphylococcus pseudoxylosus]MEB6044374.1 solute:sodium symporter family transporter [Staphylococcus pseudoxylosus]MEB6171013.1 solute:sodium symporter family transporter [Staphylococcus pseudoxylosus]MEB6331756.1 solute:sodium symporter family transporter [Staphylococcus pseudoxylosus]MEB8009224.1 solute:sodium symporter family transporter [Staphylococcus pseudo